MIERLELRNFTVFKDLGIDFSPKINVVIGENGTGKTHLLKAAYGLCAATAPLAKKNKPLKKEISSALTNKFLRLFMPLENKLGRMRKHGASKEASVSLEFLLNKSLSLEFNVKSRSVKLKESKCQNVYPFPPVYIPTKETLSLVKGMTDKNHDQRTVELIFDDGYLDLAACLFRKSRTDLEDSVESDQRIGTLLPRLANMVGGLYEWSDGEFIFKSCRYEETDIKGKFFKDMKRIDGEAPHISSVMTAEGHRKIGALYQLLGNGCLNPGVSGPLFWDEPESNLNPKLMKLLVQILLELSRNGQQIILATHDYVLLKWFDLLMDKGKEDHVRFHSLYRDAETSEIKVSSTEDYLKITPNPIDEAFGFLINQEIENDMGGLGK